MTTIKQAAPANRTAGKSQERFVYVTYIATSADRVWQALVDGEVTKRYWGNCENVSDWREGSDWQHRKGDGDRKVRVLGKVIEIRPPNRLVLTWAEPDSANDPAQYSRVQFDIEVVGAAVRLTVTHDEFAIGSEMPGRISNGWPRVLSNLKSLLETGTTIDVWSHNHSCKA